MITDAWFVSHNYLFYRIEKDKVIIVEMFSEREDFMQKLFGISTIDQQKRPYAVHETIREYGDESSVKINNPGNAVMLLNELFYMKDLAEEHIYLIMIAANNQTLAFAEVARGFISKAFVGMRESCKGHCYVMQRK